MSEKCWLKTEHKQCCCNCRHHLQDFEHCATNPALRHRQGNKCICSIPKGWVCNPPEFGGKCQSNWPEHSIGCEMYEPLKVKT